MLYYILSISVRKILKLISIILTNQCMMTSVLITTAEHVSRHTKMISMKKSEAKQCHFLVIQAR